MAQKSPTRLPFILAALFSFTALGFAGFYFISERINPDLANKRFEQALARGNTKEAITHAERTLSLLENKSETKPKKIFQLRLKLARTHLEAGNYAQAANLFETMLSPKDWQTLSPLKRLDLEKDLASAYVLSGQHAKGISIFSSFLQLAGDASPADEFTEEDPAIKIENQYAKVISEAGDIFAIAFRPGLGAYNLAGDAASQLATANQMVNLGSFYGLHQRNLPAASGLLSAAYILRSAHLPASSPELAHTVMILGPIYLQTKHYKDAETLFLQAFHTQEENLGDQSPTFSLYVKYLVEVYRAQGRLTEANALAQYMRTLFLDRFGRTRYSLRNDVPETLVRPASRQYKIPVNYQPDDLVGVASYLIPVSSSRNIGSHPSTTIQAAQHTSNIAISLARESVNGESDVNMPVRLAQLMTVCREENIDEAISVSKGYQAATDKSSSGSSQTLSYPGDIEHQLGLAIDFNVNGRLMRQSDKSWLCMLENAWQFGFILSYPQFNTGQFEIDNFEPWHWRYIGVDTARLYQEVGPLFNPQGFLANVDCFRDAAINDTSAKVIDQSSFASHCLRSEGESNLGLRYSNPISAPSLKPSTEKNIIQNTSSPHLVRTSLVASKKARKLAHTKGLAFAQKGRRKEAGILYINALRELDHVYGPSTSQHGLTLGILADILFQQDQNLRGTILKDHMRAILFNRQDTSESSASHTNANIEPSLNPVALGAQQNQLTSNTKTSNSFGVITRPVTQYFLIDAGYEPNDLVPANDHGIPVSKDPSLDEMKLRLVSEDSKNDTGENTSPQRTSLPFRLAELIQICSAQSQQENISLRSGFRAFNTQRDLYQRLRHRGTVTPPGMSEHQTGLAADIDVNGRFMRETDQTFSCFMENAHHFGFILSYPQGNNYLPSVDTFEPWHWRYVGVDTAKLYRDHGPERKPQEFLAALDCYKEQATARETYNLDSNRDFCFYKEQKTNFDLPEPEHNQLSLADGSPTNNTSEENAENPIRVNQENPEAARILNKVDN